MSQRPQLVQFGDLTPAHLAAHPVWIQCHVVDHDEPWHGETDEETFRPWTGPLPAGPEEGMLLVAADLTLADGTSLDGFLTPAFPDDAEDPALLGIIQPQIFLPSGARSATDRARLYADLGRTSERVFPIRFRAKAGLTTGLAAGEIAASTLTTGRAMHRRSVASVRRLAVTVVVVLLSLAGVLTLTGVIYCHRDFAGALHCHSFRTAEHDH